MYLPANNKRAKIPWEIAGHLFQDVQKSHTVPQNTQNRH